MDAFQVQYRLTADDFQAFDRYQWNQRRWLKWSIPLLVLGVPTLVVILTDLVVGHDHHNISDTLKTLVSPLMIGSVVLLLFYLVFIRQNYTQLEKKSPEIFDERSTEIAPEYLINRDVTGEVRIFWASIEKIVQDEKHIFFIFRENEGGSIVPKRAFLSPVEEVFFFQTASHYWKPNAGNPW